MKKIQKQRISAHLISKSLFGFGIQFRAFPGKAFAVQLSDLFPEGFVNEAASVGVNFLSQQLTDGLAELRNNPVFYKTS
ncbi:MAG TPA: hypothetical protein VK859_08005 [bacterium]|nr:hypothetical protein [bacterium]